MPSLVGSAGPGLRLLVPLEPSQCPAAAPDPPFLSYVLLLSSPRSSHKGMSHCGWREEQVSSLGDHGMGIKEGRQVRGKSEPSRGPTPASPTRSGSRELGSPLPFGGSQLCALGPRRAALARIPAPLKRERECEDLVFGATWGQLKFLRPLPRVLRVSSILSTSKPLSSWPPN